MRAPIMELAMEWSRGDPELCADIVVKLTQLVENERAACVRLCEDMVLYTGHDCATAIRARSFQ